MSIDTLPRMMRGIYPMTVFLAVLLSWTSVVHGTESTATPLHFKKPGSPFAELFASHEAPVCKASDAWSFRTHNRCSREQQSDRTLAKDPGATAQKEVSL